MKVKSDRNCGMNCTLDTISAFRFTMENYKTFILGAVFVQ